MTIAFRGVVGAWAVAMLFAGLPACGSSSGKCGANCNVDAAADRTHDAAGERGKETMDATTPHDATDDGKRDAHEPVDLANPCDQSLAAACSATHDGGGFSLHCSMTWTSSMQNPYLCARPQTTVLTTTCGDYQELIDTNGNDEYIYIYDAAGDLQAVAYVGYKDGGTSTHCIAGSAGFVYPQGCSTTDQLFTCSTDVGAHG